MINSSVQKGLVGLMAGGMAVGLVACGGSSGGGGGNNETFKLTAEVQGLGPGEVVLDVNGSPLTLSDNGTATLAESLDSGSEYTVSVAEQPESPLQDCQVSSASGQIESDLTVDVTCSTPVAIAGKLTVSGADGQTVTLTAGNVSETATADASGNFEIQADLADPDAVIRLDASEGDWHFRSLMGSVVGLSSDADLPVESDRNQIDETVTGRANLNHLNTSLSAQLQWQNGGDEFDDHAALARAGRELLTQDAAAIAGALRLVTEEGEPLPGYAGDTFAAALDFPAALDWLDAIRSSEGSSTAAALSPREQLVEGASGSRQPAVDGHREMHPTSLSNASTLDGSTDKAVSEATVSSASFSDLPAEMFLTGGHAWGHSSYAGKLDLLASEAWLRESDGRLVSGPFSLSDGDIHLSFSGYPDPFYTGETMCSDGSGGQEPCTVELYYDSVIIRQIMDGLAGDMVEKEDEIRVEYPDNEHEPDTTRTETTFVGLMTPGDNVELDESDLAGELAMPMPYERWKDDSETRVKKVADILDFDVGGTVEMNSQGTSMVWEVRSDGDLEMRPTDGGTEVYRGWLFSGTSDGEGFMLVDSDHSNDQSIVAGRTLRRDPSLFFEASDLEGRWELYEGASLDYSGTWVLDYDRSAKPDVAYLGDETDIADRPYRIEFNGDPQDPAFTLATCTTINSNGDLVYTAPSSIGLPSSTTDPDCDFMYIERSWQIIRFEDDRLYHAERQVRYLPDGSDWKKQLDQDTIRYFGDVGDAQL